MDDAEDEKYGKERLQWYETMQKPIFDRRREIDEIRKLAKLSLKPEKASSSHVRTMKSSMSSSTALSLAGATSSWQPSSSVTNSNNSTTEQYPQIANFPHQADSMNQQQLVVVSTQMQSSKQLVRQKTIKEIRGEDLLPPSYLKLLTDPVLVNSSMENYIHTTVICFPGLGCSYSYFHSVAQMIHKENHAAVYSVCLPQRMERIMEDLSAYRFYDIVLAIRNEILEKQLVSLRPDRKLIFYGHSIGGFFAYELCRSLQRAHYHVSGLIIDSIRSPFRQTMFNYSEDPHGLDDHTIATHESHADNRSQARSSTNPGKPPKPYYAQDFQPIRDSSLLPTISSHLTTPAGSIHNGYASQTPPALSRGNSQGHHPPPLSRGNSNQQSPASLSRTNSHHDHHAHGAGHGAAHGGLLGAALFNRSEQQGRDHHAPNGPHGHSTARPPLSRGHSTVSALSYREGDELAHGHNGDITQYEPMATEEREILPSFLHDLSDKQLHAVMFKLGGLPPLFAARRDLLRKALHCFRQDINLLHQYFVSAPVIPGFPYVDKLFVDKEDVQELLEMPPSMFKLHFPVFSIHGDLDPWIQNEEVMAWSLASNSYDHFVIEDANHYHVQNERFVEIILSLVSRIQSQREESEGEGEEKSKGNKSDEEE